ncbi:DUF2958 domain-containing protein [Blastomonas fulva]|uniref:Single-stranded DNA endonuclease n=1 Tax=Blastomonas fulva TaxID=1550728 RepID=A0ABN5B3S8_9SPHN|nr:DUF2958 domain-containing protein [Blastomonas fulva]ASR50299.1 hypothetical protein B5J99_01455 [Blastomonas fulva]
MKLLTRKLAAKLQFNARQRAAALGQGSPEPDPLPVVRFFNPLGSASWLATELDEDGILFGLADLGFGCPELGSFALFELEDIRLPLGLRIERDIVFDPVLPLSVYTYAARQCGAIVTAQSELAMAASALRARQLDR